MTTKHTPGPWTVGYKDDQCVYAGAKRVAVVQCDTRKNWAADARLIAAAPELLDVLEIIKLNFDEGCAMAPGTPSYHMLCEVIAKATGAQP